MKKRKLFEIKVFETFGQESEFEKIKFMMNRCYELLSDINDFKKMKVDIQYLFCSTVCCIHLGASNKYLRQSFILQTKEVTKVEKEFCLEFGFLEPKRIDISQDAMRLLGS